MPPPRDLEPQLSPDDPYEMPRHRWHASLEMLSEDVVMNMDDEITCGITP